MRNDHYGVKKVDEQKSSNNTTTLSDHMEPWIGDSSDELSKCERYDNIWGQIFTQDGQVYNQKVSDYSGP